ncbi:MAG: NADH-quinone oxidoreductase subunit J [Actinomycetota bacterium]|nr:NADH-quinone oxidoreductase subunit J [Actinomycetota bacterium]
MPLDNVVFWVFAPISVASAIGLLAMRNAVHAALFLVVNFFTLAVMFLLLDAPFLFAVQIVVYAGAIMVLFLFVIMLLGVEGGEPVRDRLAVQRPIAIALGVAFAAEIAAAVHAGIGFATRAPTGFDRVNAGGNPQAVAKVLFQTYFFPFEATSVLLIVAAIAAMVMAQKKAPAITQAEAEASRPTAGPADREVTA